MAGKKEYEFQLMDRATERQDDWYLQQRRNISEEESIVTKSSENSGSIEQLEIKFPRPGGEKWLAEQPIELFEFNMDNELIPTFKIIPVVELIEVAYDYDDKTLPYYYVSFKGSDDVARFGFVKRDAVKPLVPQQETNESQHKIEDVQKVDDANNVIENSLNNSLNTDHTNTNGEDLLLQSTAAADPLAEERLKIIPKNAFTEEQKVLFNWDAVLKQFADANKPVGTETFAWWELKRWVRIALKNGWKEGDPIPLARKVQQIGEKNGHPIYSALNYDFAFAYARKHSLTGKFYYVNNITGYELPYSSGTSLAPKSAYKNFELNKDKVVDFEMLRDFSNDQASYDEIMKIKFYNDKLLSVAFVKLVQSVQLAIYDNTTDDGAVDGVFTQKVHTDMLAKKKSDNDARLKKEKEDALLLGDDGIAVPGRTGYFRFMRDGKELIVNKQMLKDLRYQIYILDDTDPLVDYTDTHFKVGDTENVKPVFTLLTLEQRKTLLKAYEAEYWLWEDQEKLVNMMIDYTPSDQKKGLNDWLLANNKEHYNEIKEDQENTGTRRTFYQATENLYVIKDGDVAVVDQDVMKEISDAVVSKNVFELNRLVNEMSQLQMAALPFDQRIKIIDLFTDISHRGQGCRVEELITTTPVIERIKMANELANNNLKKMGDVLATIGEDKSRKLSETGLDPFYGSYPSLLTNVKDYINYPAKAPYDYELYFYRIPSAIYRQLTNDEKVKLVQLINSGTYDDPKDEATVIRVVSSVGENFTKKEDAQKKIDARQDFYNKLYDKDKDFTNLYYGFQGDNYYELSRLMSAFNSKDYKGQQANVTNAGYYSKDTEIDRLSFEAMQVLTLEKRQEYIKTILGRSAMDDAVSKDALIHAKYFTRVGTEDEQAIIRLLNSTPAADVPPLLKWLQDNEGDFYNELHAAMHGEEFKALHESLDELSRTKLSEDLAGDPEKYKAQMDEIEWMKRDGLKHPKVIPWADPGFFKGMAADYRYEYKVTWTSTNQIQIIYYNLAAGALPVPVVKIYDPWELIGIKFIYNDSDLNATEGEVRVMPAIYAFLVESKQTVRQVGEALDLIFLALGVAEISAAIKAARAIQLAIAALDVTLTVGSLVVNSFKEELPESVKQAYQSVSMMFSVYQVFKLGKVAIDAGRDQLNNFRNLVATAKANKTLTAAGLEAMEAELKRLNGMEELAKTLDDADINKLKQLRDELDATEFPGSPAQKDELLEALNERIAKVNNKSLISNQQASADAIEIRDAEIRKEANITKVDDTKPVEVVKADETKVVVNDKVNTDVNAGGGGAVTKIQVEQPKFLFSESLSKVGDEVVALMPPNTHLRFVKKGRKWKLLDETVFDKQQLDAIYKRYPVDKFDDMLEQGGDLNSIINKNVEVPKTVFDQKKLDRILANLQEKDGVKVWRGDDAEEFLKQNGATAMYLPGEGGAPGTLVFSKNASRTAVIEELKHLGEHRKLGWKQLSSSEMINIEVKAQDELLKYAEKNNWTKQEIDQIKSNKEYWEQTKKSYDTDVEFKKKFDEEVVGMTNRVVSEPREITDLLANSTNIYSLTSAPKGYIIVTEGLRRYIKRINAADPNLPRLSVDEKGIIVRYTGSNRVSNSGTFSRNLEKVLGKMPENHQRHHLVPDNVARTSSLHIEARSRGIYSVDRATNGVYLAVTAEDMVEGVSKNLPTHNGSHPKFDENVEEMIEFEVTKLKATYPDLSKVPDDVLINALLDIEDKANSILAKWKTPKLD